MNAQEILATLARSPDPGRRYSSTPSRAAAISWK
jgi:hypothetical protein